ncbi:hypothetical protein [Argonema antarcticum]|uniref:hypothetical protein n=1 Tax=Argonema antarcticum TaxID=2942763 RepID=UPI0020125C8C|nr:hypothetical protein [Argonema antarcticum]MCL1472264.1 hypothetical protein [Argonema antarcticum A004/B2]
MKIPTLSHVLSNAQQTTTVTKSNHPGQNLTTHQEIICQFFLNIVKQQSPDLVLSEFERLFINPVGLLHSEPQKALKEILYSNNQSDFINTLKRSIYILLNNWIFSRKYKPAQDLIELLSNLTNRQSTLSVSVKNLRMWLNIFINSEDYEELKLFVSRYDHREKEHWKSRYTSYLLAPQYTNSKNLIEQREAARGLAKQLQEEFKFDLAMYTAHSHSASSKNRKTENPTALGDEALRLIKKVVGKRGAFNYVSLGNIFIKQTQRLTYSAFKQSLLKYLIFSLDNQGLAEALKTGLTKKLEFLYQTSNEEELSNALLLKTCNRVIEYLTTEKDGKPSSLFVSLASQGNPLTLSILLLKIILICPRSRTHLEVCMAKLIENYESYSQKECHWVINFLEISKIILTIYTENVRYNLVNMENVNLTNQSINDGDSYRVFSQTKWGM